MAARKVAMYDPASDGVIQADPSEVKSLEEAGYEINTPDAEAARNYAKNAGVLDAAISAGEGALSGLTLGLSDVGLSALGGQEYTRGRRLRDNVFGNLNTTTQVLGTVIPMAFSGGTSLLAKGAALTPTALAGRLGMAAEGLTARGIARFGVGAAGKSIGREALERAASMGVGAAVEGSLAGAGSALSEAAINDQLGGPDRVAELAWAGAKGGAMFGLFGGAALGGLSGATIGGAKRLGERFLRGSDALTEAADESAIKAIIGGQGLRSSEARKFGSIERIREAGNKLRNYTLSDGRAVIEAGEKMEGIAPKLAQGRQEVGAALGDIRTRAGEMGLPDAESFVRRVKSDVLEPLLSSSSPTIRARANKVISELSDFETRVASRRASLEAADEAVSRVEELVAPMSKSRSARVAAKAEEIASKARALREAVGAGSLTQAEFRGFLDDVLPTLGRAPSSSVRQQAKALQKELKKAAITDAITLDDLVRQKDTLSDVINPRTPDGYKAEGIKVHSADDNELFRARNVLEKSIDEHIESVLPQEAARYRELKDLYGVFKNADKTAQKYMTNNIANRAVSLTDYLAGMGGVTAALTTGSPFPMIGAVALPLANKLLRERGASTLAALVTRAERTGVAMDKAIDKFFETARARVRPALGAANRAATGSVVGFDLARVLHAQRDEKPEEAYDRLASRIKSASEGALTSAMTVDDVAPMVGHAMRGVQMRAAQYLAARMPAPPRTTDNPNLAALANQRRPDPVQLYEFARRVEAVENPKALLRDLAQGTLSPAAVDAVREVYPKLYAEMQARVLDKLGDEKELLHYEDRVRLGLLFDLPTDPTLRPEYLQLTQQAYQAQESAPKVKPLPPGPSPRAKQLQTVAEQLETGEYPA